MSAPLLKEFRPLILPLLITGAGSVIPPPDGPLEFLGPLACFGGFTIFAAIAVGLEFQQRTLGLLLSQPVERSQVWHGKLRVVFLAGLAVVFVNWRVQESLCDLPPLALLLVWLSLLGSLCASGFWVQRTKSVYSGILCSVLAQLLVFGGVGWLLSGRSYVAVRLSIDELLVYVGLPGLLYCAAFVWLGRQFWREASLKVATGVLLVLFVCGLSQWLTSKVPHNTSGADTVMGILFLLAAACSCGFWTLLARTVIGGAVFTIAAQFMMGLLIVLILSLTYGSDVDPHQFRQAGLLIFFGFGYCILFLWLGFKRFARLELRDASNAETDSEFPSFVVRLLCLPDWLRCRSHQSLGNLVRKEVRLQKPLLMLTAIFSICWLGACSLQWLKPHRGYANLKDILVCLYAPMALLLAGCISLGEEKVLGLTTSYLTQPVRVRTQWLIKLVVAALTGASLGLLFPFCLDWLSAWTMSEGLLRESHGDAWKAVGVISACLFLLGFWAATLSTSTVRAALAAVAALVALWVCVVFGWWCAQSFIAGFGPFRPSIASGDDVSGGVELGRTALFMTLVLGAAMLLWQSFCQFRRAQLPTSTLIKAPLALSGLVVVCSFLVWCLSL